MNQRERNEDLFESTRMSFGQHIEELRKCLVRALYGLGLASIIGFMYADELVSFLQRPLETAIREFDQAKAKQDIIEEHGYFDTEFTDWIDTEQWIPETVMVSPDQVSNLDGQVTISNNPRLLGLDIVEGKTGTIAKRLLRSSKEKPDGELTGDAAIWRRLTPEEQQQVRQLAKATSLSADDTLNLKSMLGRITIESRLYEDTAFDELTTEPEKGWLSFFTDTGTKPVLPQMKRQVMESDAEDPTLARKLNRALIHSVFLDELTPPRANLVPMVIWRPGSVETQSLSPHEPFMIWMKAGFFASLVIASPWILFQLWTFVSAGLYPHEKRYVHWYLPISVLLFFAGVSLAFFFVMTPVLDFLFKFNATMGISPQLRINYWLSFVMYLPLGFGIAFQLPLVMLVLNRLGIIEIGVYLSKWRIAVMIIFVLSMLLTPADPLSMIMLAVPLTVLYFFGIALCKWMPRNRNPFGEVYEPA